MGWRAAYRRHAVRPLSMASLQPLHGLHLVQHSDQLTHSKGVHLESTDLHRRFVLKLHLQRLLLLLSLCLPW